MVTSWVPGTPVTTMTNLTTSWYTPTIDPSYTPSMPTFTPNATRSSLLAERTKYCWITAEDENNGFFPDDLSDNCFSLYAKYCDVAVTDPIPSPSPTGIPGSCTPKETTFSPTSSTTSSPSSTSSGVATPTPTQPGMTEDCTKFHMVKDGDTCASIADKYGISQADFLAWNPDVGEDCKNLWLDTYVCVSSSESTPRPTATSTTSTSSSPTTGATPSPIQPGMTDGCTKFHKVADGDICASIAEQYGISEADFLAWNPGVGEDCSSLWLDYYVCVSKS